MITVIVLIVKDVYGHPFEIETYGSIVSMLENKLLTHKGKELTARKLYYRLEKSDCFKTDNYEVHKKTLIRKAN